MNIRYLPQIRSRRTSISSASSATSDALDADLFVTRADAALERSLAQAIADERFVGEPVRRSRFIRAAICRPRALALIGCGSRPPPPSRPTASPPAASRARPPPRCTLCRPRPRALRRPPARLELESPPKARRSASIISTSTSTPASERRLVHRSPSSPRRRPPMPLTSDDATAVIARARETARAVAGARPRQRARRVPDPAAPRRDRATSRPRDWSRLEVLDRDACRKLGMGLFLAVAQGSAEEPRFIHLAWKPRARDEAGRARRQGRHLRLGRPLAQDQRRHARHEDRHGRRRRRARRHESVVAEESCPSRSTRSRRAPRTCRRAPRTSSATSSRRWRARPSRSTTPTPRAASRSPTR